MALNLNLLATAQAAINRQASIDFVVGQQIAQRQRIAQALALAEIRQARDERTYVNTLHRDLLNAGVRVYAGMASADVARLAAAQASEGMVDVTSLIAQKYSRLIRARRGPGGAFATANREVGREANRAAELAFQGTKRPNSSSFRASEGGLRFRRYAGGQMSLALLSDKNFIAKADGLFWIVAPHLDLAAPQWYRLNFGAGALGAATNGSRSFQVTFFGQNVGVVGLAAFRASPTFTLPPGFFTSDGSWTGRVASGSPSGQAFRPANFNRGQIRAEQSSSLQSRVPFITRQTKQINFDFNTTPIVTKGIRAQNFLDAGMASIARTWPVAQTRVIKDVLNESVLSGGTTTAISVAGVDLVDQRQFAVKVNTEFDAAIAKLKAGVGSNRVSSAFLGSLR